MYFWINSILENAFFFITSNSFIPLLLILLLIHLEDLFGDFNHLYSL